MGSHIVKIQSIRNVTHDVLQIMTEKPAGYAFTPGQATEVAINKEKWTEQKRPFSFTSLPDAGFLEFTIKTYPARKGVTAELLNLKPNDELILHDVWGAISYKGEGVFIAGGAGVTPFLSIFRYLNATGRIGGNKLIFANKTRADIIQMADLKNILGGSFINILSDEEVTGYAHGYITRDFLKKNIDTFDKMFYVCGPPPMMNAVQDHLTALGVANNSFVVEI
jgi:ferredoxin-NADP reductase